VAVTYLPDTNAWSSFLRQKHPALVRRFQQEDPGDIALCSVVLAELLYGVYHGPPAYRAHNMGLVVRMRQNFASLPFDDRAADEYGEIRAHLAGAGTPIGPNDLIIASIARANGLTVVTRNVGEFGRVPGLNVEDWQGGP
jgi:tRNA(fMet)-specific endonuclease VapC